MNKLYGIPNCDSVKKVRNLLEDHQVDYEFINFKKEPPKKQDIKRWKAFHGELPVNKRGTTFRKIKEEFEEGSLDEQTELLIENSSALIRPILEADGKVTAIGFKAIQELYS